MLTIEQKIARSKEFYRLLSTDKSLKFVDDYVDPQFQLHDAALPNLPKGPEGIRQYFKTFFGAFPDMTITVKDIFGSDDKLALQWVAVGTNTGPFMGGAPTGKKITTEGASIEHFEGKDKVVETWAIWDTHSLLVQLGLVAEAPEVRAQTEQRPGVQ